VGFASGQQGDSAACPPDAAASANRAHPLASPVRPSLSRQGALGTPDDARSPPPPEHWLARVYFELCWLTYDRNLRDHHEAFFDAIERGLRDPELAIVAEKLKELFPAYEPEC